MFKRFKPSPIHLVADLLKRTKSGKILAQKKQKIQELTHYIHSQLPAEQSPHLVRAYIEGSQLILVIDNSAWATRIRYAGTHILSQLRTQNPREYAGLMGIKTWVSEGETRK